MVQKPGQSGGGEELVLGKELEPVPQVLVRYQVDGGLVEAGSD